MARRVKVRAAILPCADPCCLAHALPVATCGVGDTISAAGSAYGFQGSDVAFHDEVVRHGPGSPGRWRLRCPTTISCADPATRAVRQIATFASRSRYRVVPHHQHSHGDGTTPTTSKSNHIADPVGASSPSTAHTPSSALPAPPPALATPTTERVIASARSPARSGSSLPLAVSRVAEQWLDGGDGAGSGIATPGVASGDVSFADSATTSGRAIALNPLVRLQSTVRCACCRSPPTP